MEMGVGKGDICLKLTENDKNEKIIRCNDYLMTGIHEITPPSSHMLHICICSTYLCGLGVD